MSGLVHPAQQSRRPGLRNQPPMISKPRSIAGIEPLFVARDELNVLAFFGEKKHIPSVYKPTKKMLPLNRIERHGIAEVQNAFECSEMRKTNDVSDFATKSRADRMSCRYCGRRRKFVPHRAICLADTPPDRSKRVTPTHSDPRNKKTLPC
jgi:hypothetical protein